jgi:hypothetical protein
MTATKGGIPGNVSVSQKLTPAAPLQGDRAGVAEAAALHQLALYKDSPAPQTFISRFDPRPLLGLSAEVPPLRRGHADYSVLRSLNQTLRGLAVDIKTRTGGFVIDVDLQNNPIDHVPGLTVIGE